MPGISRTQRAEAKYNVVFEFANLGLHTAAITGNLGLVKYALDHGQPVNSAMDGVLPLHAASYGGNELVVRYLIEHGADVNTPRLPRRYSTDKSRAAASALPIQASSGSTSLHFASTKGHIAVILTLLSHGAHPDQADKHGVTPEMVARQNGFTECANVLQQWGLYKDKDLRDRETPGARPSEDGAITGQKPSHAYCGKCYDCTVLPRVQKKRQTGRIRHLEERYQTELEAKAAREEALMHRRPSLPQALESPMEDVGTSFFGRDRHASDASAPTSRRPRSAGTDAQSSLAPRMKSKSSLLSFLKRGLEGSMPDSLSISSSTVPSTSVSPAPTSTSASFTSELISQHNSLAGNQLHQRILSDTTSSSSFLTRQEPRRALSRDHLRSQASLGGNDSSAIRPGILRTHSRSSSGGQSLSQTPPADGIRSGSSVSSAKALRFQHSATSLRRSESLLRKARTESHSPARGIAGRGSLSSLRSQSPSSRWGRRQDNEPHSPISPSPTSRGRGYIEEEEEEAEYGKPVAPQSGLKELAMRLGSLTSRSGSRRASVDSKASDLESQDTISHLFDCPFSINRPPPETVQTPLVPGDHVDRASLENRMRGNSLSSMVTDTSGGPPSSCIPTPALNHPTLPASFNTGQMSELPSPVEELVDSRDSLDVPQPKRHKSPQKIDIRSISSHAQAEALVQRAQQRILSMNEDEDEEDKVFNFALGEGHTPLSARLAAYGESLAIQRRLKEEEAREARRHQSLDAPRSHPENIFVLNDDPASAPVTRQFNLSRSAEEPTRPHTSDGQAPDPERFYIGEWASEEAFSVTNPKYAAHAWLEDGDPVPPIFKSRKFQYLNYKFHPDMPSPPPSPPPPEAIAVPGQLYETPLPPRLATKERHAARSQKLSKMGLPAPTDSWKESPRGQRNHRFGGIKTLVQSLTGRT